VFKNTFFKHILSSNDQKNTKIWKYHTFSIVLLLEKRWLNQNTFIFMCFWVGSSHEPVVVRSNWICQSQNARHKTFYSKASLLPYSWKKHVNLYWNYTPSLFLSFRILVLYLSSFNFSIFVSLANNCTDLKLVRKQNWNFNEFNFYIW
jgi:hypothetical protein